MSDNQVDSSWLEMYLFESISMIEQLELIIIVCEKEQEFSQENINEIFRIMHTIKGSSSMMDFTNIANIAHSLEDIFYYIREERPMNLEYSVICDFVLSGIDFMKAEIDKIKNGLAADRNEDELVKLMKDYLHKLKEDKKKKIGIKSNYKAHIHFQNGCEMENIRAYSIIHSMPCEMDDISYDPCDILENEESANYIRENGFILKFSTIQTYDEIYSWLLNSSFVLSVELIKNLDISLQSMEGIPYYNNHIESLPTRNVSLKDELEDDSIRLQESSSQKATSMITVSVDKLDRLLDLIGEIVIAEDMVIQNPDLHGLKLDNFKKAANQLSKITGDIQDLVMEIRMVPLQATFLKMNRVVRDVSKKLGKEVELVIIGEDTEVDKKIIELISDPIMHLVRNGLDHGLESTEERIENGKSSVGKITLEAKNVGSDVIIQVKDDGKGLDKNRILQKAIENGIVKADRELSDREIYNLILSAGFSTKEEVTEFSGRGVGMDVVAKNIESIGGTLYVDSNYGVGSTITLKIPLTLAIIDGMNIKVGNARYTIPTIAIKETFRPKGHEIIRDPNGHEMIMVRGECYNIRKLYDLYKVESNIKDYTKGIIVMVEQDEKMVAIFADELIGQQQVVVKALPDFVKRFQRKQSGLAGCTLLGDGSISLILDISKMISMN